MEIRSKRHFRFYRPSAALVLTYAHVAAYQTSLRQAEKSPATIEKYTHDAARFCRFADHQPLTKELVLAYKQSLIDKNYKTNSINAMLCGLNSFLIFLGYGSFRVQGLRRQRQIYRAEDRTLNQEEYLRLLQAASKKPWLQLALQTICSTGIRISELKYFTVETIRTGVVTVSCKGKVRTILLPRRLCDRLKDYCKNQKIQTGAVFCTRNGKPLDRSFIWLQMKRLCTSAQVASSKVFPHNLRKLFAITFYKIDKNIVRLADALGHSSIDTTRIYLMTTQNEVQRTIEQLRLVI